MKTKFTQSLILVGTLMVLAISCRPKFYEEPSLNSGTPFAGSANFSKYVAVGAGIEAGFMDGALYNEGQSVAYPNLIAQQLKSVNPNLVFNQPNVNSNNGFAAVVSGNPVGRFLFTLVTCTTQNFNRTQQPGDYIASYSGDKSALNNFGIPYLNINQLNVALTGTPPASASNSGNDPRWYYSNVVPSPGVSKLTSVVKGSAPTFFTAWIGYTEFLNYVQKGGSVALPSIDTVNISILLDSLLANGGSGVIANIPDVTLFPVIYNNNRRFTNASDPILNKPISTSSVLGASIRTYSFSVADSIAYNASLAASGPVNFKFKTKTNNGYAYVSSSGTIKQLNLPAATDQLNSGSLDLVVLSRAQLDSVGFGDINYECKSGTRARWGLSKPIPNAGVLDGAEIALVRNQISAFNNALKRLVDRKNASGVKLGLVSIDKLFTNLSNPVGIIASKNVGNDNALSFSQDAIYNSHPQLGPDFGGFFSLDRIHPTPKGQALIANEFIKSINSTFGANVPLVDPSGYRGNIFPVGY